MIFNVLNLTLPTKPPNQSMHATTSISISSAFFIFKNKHVVLFLIYTTLNSSKLALLE